MLDSDSWGCCTKLALTWTATKSLLRTTGKGELLVAEPLAPPLQGIYNSINEPMKAWELWT